jgi:hypothetical protein
MVYVGKKIPRTALFSIDKFEVAGYHSSARVAEFSGRSSANPSLLQPLIRRTVLAPISQSDNRQPVRLKEQYAAELQLNQPVR